MNKQIKCIATMTTTLVLVTGCIFDKASFDTKGINTGDNKNKKREKLLDQKTIIRSDYKKNEITKICDQVIADTRAKLNNKPENALAIDKILADFGDQLNPVTFMGYVHANEKIRNEASQCEEKYSQFKVEVFTRRDLYQVVSQSVGQNPAQLRLISEMKRSFELNGMSLSDADLEKFKAFKNELATLESAFSKNMNEEQSSITLTESELEGTSADFKGRLKKNKDGNYIVTTKNTDFFQIMENAVQPEVRKKMLIAYDNRAANANTPLLEKAILLRQEIAKIMGYKTWADYRTDGRMAKNGDTPLALLSDLKEKLKPRLAKDLDLQLQAKKDMEDVKATELFAWDVRYFANQVKKRNYSLDDEVIREYFPKDIVVGGMFQIYSKLLSVNYELVENANVWDENVKLYAVRDQQSNDVLAYFYADMHPRPGKYGHAAAFSLISGRVLEDGKYSLPVASIVSNFTPPTKDKPSLLTHDEVETLFHEFGHIMHQILTRAPYAYLSGTEVAQDFVEAPSQMLEGWVWDAEMLNIISGHYTDTNKKLPADLIEKMVQAKDFNIGYHYSRQIVLGLTDLTMHTATGAVNIHETYQKVHLDTLGFKPVEGSRWMAGFGHMMGGYDAGYYGYIWSEVYAADMFTAFQANGMLDSVTGRAYRNLILESGNMRDPLELVAGFLGREPNNLAFLKKLGL